MRSSILLVLLPAWAGAQSFDLYGFQPKSIAMAGVGAAADGDFTATFYNPALLRGGSAGVGFHWAKPSLSVTATGEPTASQELSARAPVDFSGLSFGAALPLGGLLKDRASIGLGLYLPRARVFRSYMIDESTAQFFRYDNAPERLQLVLGASVRPFPWLGLGAGVQLLSDFGGDARFTLVMNETGTGRVTRRALGSEITGAAAPTAGAFVEPRPGLRLYAAFRNELKSTYELPIGVDMGGFGLLDVLVRGVSHFAPHALSVGASGVLAGGRLTLAVDVGREWWSRTPPLVADITVDISGLINSDVDSREVVMGFSDTYVPRVGAEWRHTERLAFRAGYFFRPSPAPDQTGRTNFLDSNAHVLSGGAGYAFDDPLRMASRLTVDAAAQLALLSERQVEKEGPNVNPNYRFGGSVLELSVAVRYEL